MGLGTERLMKLLKTKRAEREAAERRRAEEHRRWKEEHERALEKQHRFEQEELRRVGERDPSLQRYLETLIQRGQLFLVRGVPWKGSVPAVHRALAKERRRDKDPARPRVHVVVEAVHVTTAEAWAWLRTRWAGRGGNETPTAITGPAALVEGSRELRRFVRELLDRREDLAAGIHIVLKLAWVLRRGKPGR